MRSNLLFLVITSLAAGCLGEVDGGRKPGSSDSKVPTDGACAKVEKDVTVRTAADMAALPRTGCYDIMGKLTLQGSVITSLVGLEQLNAVEELDLDHTALTTIDTKRPIRLYGRLTVTGNPKLTSLKQVQFETASDGVLIDGNGALVSLDALTLDAPKLEEVTGDVTITGNPALTAVSLKHLRKVTGKLLVSGNAAVKSVDLSKLATTGGIEIADSNQLTSLTGFAATDIHGDLVIRNNPLLTTLGTMSALFRITGDLRIDSNAALTNLAAFTTTVKRINQTLAITNNRNLTDLGALKRLELVNAITITNNQSLSICRAIEIDQCTAHPTAAVIANNQNNDCNWQCN